MTRKDDPDFMATLFYCIAWVFIIVGVIVGGERMTRADIAAIPMVLFAIYKRMQVRE